MNWKRTATLGLVGGTLVTLLARASTSNAPPQASSSAPKVAIAAEHNMLMAEIDRLHDRLRAPLTPIVPSRNLFEFRRAAPAAARAPDAAAATRDAPLPTAPRPGPALALLGLAEEAGPDGPIRTAILSGAGGLQFVRIGDALADGSRVIAIRDDAVELDGPADRPRLVLTLR